jgi:hypothetical protein
LTTLLGRIALVTAWTVFAVLSGIVALLVAACGAAIHRECKPALAR